MHTSNGVAHLKMHGFWSFRAAVSMEGSHVEWSLPARRKTAGFHEEMVKVLSSISAILQHSKPSALDPIRIFG
jgi:hypothetical protein